MAPVKLPKNEKQALEFAKTAPVGELLDAIKAKNKLFSNDQVYRALLVRNVENKDFASAIELLKIDPTVKINIINKHLHEHGINNTKTIITSLFHKYSRFHPLIFDSIVTAETNLGDYLHPELVKDTLECINSGSTSLTRATLSKSHALAQYYNEKTFANVPKDPPYNDAIMNEVLDFALQGDLGAMHCLRQEIEKSNSTLSHHEVAEKIFDQAIATNPANNIISNYGQYWLEIADLYVGSFDNNIPHISKSLVNKNPKLFREAIKTMMRIHGHLYVLQNAHEMAQREQQKFNPELYDVIAEIWDTTSQNEKIQVFQRHTKTDEALKEFEATIAELKIIAKKTRTRRGKKNPLDTVKAAGETLLGRVTKKKDGKTPAATREEATASNPPAQGFIVPVPEVPGQNDSPLVFPSPPPQPSPKVPPADNENAGTRPKKRVKRKTKATKMSIKDMWNSLTTKQKRLIVGGTSTAIVMGLIIAALLSNAGNGKAAESREESNYLQHQVDSLNQVVGDQVATIDDLTRRLEEETARADQAEEDARQTAEQLEEETARANRADELARAARNVRQQTASTTTSKKTLVITYGDGTTYPSTESFNAKQH